MNSLELVPAFESGMPTATDLIWLMSTFLGALILLAIVAYVLEIVRLMHESGAPLPASEFHGCGQAARRPSAVTTTQMKSPRLRPSMHPAGTHARLAPGL